MAPRLHDANVRSQLMTRVRALQPNARGRWGRMTVDQMLWHVNVSLRECAGDYKPEVKAPLPKWLMRWGILNLPWGRGATTRPDMRVVSAHDFNEQKSLCLSLLDRIAARPLDAHWPESASMGRMKGKHWSKLQARHLDHHLRQFGA